MSPPRYRTLDGDELELPLAMGCWVLVPRALARFDPELAYPRLDFSAGALLVPVDRWNDHAELEPNLAPCHQATIAPAPSMASRDKRSLAETVAAVAVRSTVVAIAGLATAYLLAVA